MEKTKKVKVVAKKKVSATRKTAEVKKAMKPQADSGTLHISSDGSIDSLRAVLAQCIRSKGVVNTSKMTGVPRSSLYSVMNEDSNPTLETVFTILNSVGYKVVVEPIEKKKKDK